MHDLSDDEVVERWVENPYWPYFCGFDFFQHRLPIDSSTMTRWRKRVGSAGMEQVLSATVGVAVDGQGQQLRADYGGVQPRAIAYPTDSRLYLKALQALRPNGTALFCAAATPVWPDALHLWPGVTPMPDSSGACAARSGN